ncbi:MAG TPA: alpha/beta fold hydrolase [Actinomycetota bacterium]
MTITTTDGVDLDARWWEAPRPGGTAVVLAHGFTGSKDEPALGAVAEALRAEGHDVLAYDARGHHGSGGLCTLGDLERHDVSAAVAVARERASRVVTIGASMGAIAVLRHAAIDPGLAGVVSVSSPALWRLPSNARSLFATALTRTALGRRVAARRWHVDVSARWDDPDPPRRLAARVTVPVVVIHGREDRFVPPKEAGLIAAAAPNARLILVPGMGHAFDRAAVPAVVRAVAWTLAASSPGSAGSAA